MLDKIKKALGFGESEDMTKAFNENEAVRQGFENLVKSLQTSQSEEQNSVTDEAWLAELRKEGRGF